MSVSCEAVDKLISETGFHMAERSGVFEMRFCMAHEMLVLFEDIPLPGSRFLCLTFLSPFCFLVNSLMYAKIFSLVFFHFGLHDFQNIFSGKFFLLYTGSKF